MHRIFEFLIIIFILANLHDRITDEGDVVVADNASEIFGFISFSRVLESFVQFIRHSFRKIHYFFSFQIHEGGELYEFSILLHFSHFYLSEFLGTMVCSSSAWQLAEAIETALSLLPPPSVLFMCIVFLGLLIIE